MAAKLVALVVPLGLDAFVVAAALGMLGTPPHAGAGLSFVHGLRRGGCR